MIVYTKVKRKDVALYHRVFDRIKASEEYRNLKEDIRKNGILDPVLIQDFPGGLRIEIGEQRLLIAEELGIEEIEAFVYNKLQPQVSHAVGERMNNIEDIGKKFRNFDVPCYKTLAKYINGKVVEV